MSSPDPTMAQISRRMLSAKAEQFTESVIREMTRLALKHGAVNLSQGFPDFAAPEEIKEAARQAISDNINQYAITWGAKPLRDAIVFSTWSWDMFNVPERISLALASRGARVLYCEIPVSRVRRHKPAQLIHRSRRRKIQLPDDNAVGLIARLADLQ